MTLSSSACVVVVDERMQKDKLHQRDIQRIASAGADANIWEEEINSLAALQITKDVWRGHQVAVEGLLRGCLPTRADNVHSPGAVIAVERQVDNEEGEIDLALRTTTIRSHSRLYTWSTHSKSSGAERSRI